MRNSKRYVRRVHFTPSTRPTPLFVKRIAVTFACAALLGACGVPLDQKDRPLRPKEMGFTPITEFVTTTTTTTTTTTSTTVVPSSVPSTTEAPTTTQILPLTYPLDVYWVSASGLVAVRRLPLQTDLDKAITALRFGPLASEENVRSAIADSEMIEGATVSGGVAVVELGPTFLGLPGSEQSLALAQIVLTVTQLPEGIGRVRFRISGRPIAVPLANGQLTNKSVSRDDYITLVAPPTTTTTESSNPVTVSTTSTVPTTES
jgi:Sporulation and spore germination